MNYAHRENRVAGTEGSGLKGSQIWPFVRYGLSFIRPLPQRTVGGQILSPRIVGRAMGGAWAMCRRQWSTPERSLIELCAQHTTFGAKRHLATTTRYVPSLVQPVGPQEPSEAQRFHWARQTHRRTCRGWVVGHAEAPVVNAGAIAHRAVRTAHDPRRRVAPRHDNAIRSIACAAYRPLRAVGGTAFSLGSPDAS